jgi:hypothetical protein
VAGRPRKAGCGIFDDRKIRKQNQNPTHRLNLKLATPITNQGVLHPWPLAMVAATFPENIMLPGNTAQFPCTMFYTDSTPDISEKRGSCTTLIFTDPCNLWLHLT